MVTLILSGIITGSSALTLWLISSGGRRERIGFLTGIAGQGLWLAFDWYVGAYALMPLAFVYAPLYWRGYRRHQAAKVTPLHNGYRPAPPPRCEKCEVFAAGPTCWKCGGPTTKAAL